MKSPAKNLAQPFRRDGLRDFADYLWARSIVGQDQADSTDMGSKSFRGGRDALAYGFWFLAASAAARPLGRHHRRNSAHICVAGAFALASRGTRERRSMPLPKWRRRSGCRHRRRPSRDEYRPGSFGDSG